MNQVIDYFGDLKIFHGTVCRIVENLRRILAIRTKIDEFWLGFVNLIRLKRSKLNNIRDVRGSDFTGQVRAEV